ncbi:MAG: choice-of-anchor E domain-containing protein, partial [Planctomycetota bacterium]|nr:choice-of-anchor E domain-containing protein [Planctomycetota bacterium]
MRTLSRLLAVAALVSGFLFPESALAQDCATNPPVTCTQGNQVDTVFGNPPTTDTCFGCPFGTQDGTWSATSTGYRQLRLPKFTLGAGVCGSLIQAELTITYQTQTVIRVENLDNKQQPIQVAVNLEGRVFPLNVPGLTSFIIPNNTNRSFVLPAFDGTIDFGGASGRTDTTPVVTNTRCFRITDPTLLAGFIAGGGSNFLLFDHASIDSSVVSGPGNVASALNTVGLLSATVTYRSCVCQVVAQDDTARVCVGNSRTIPVLTNDSTTCGALNTASLAFVGTPPAGFTISGTNIVFNATGIAAGVYVATYQVCNNQNPPCCDTATVTVTVCNTDAVNDTGRVCAGSSVTIPVLANDTTTCGTLNNASLAFVGTPPAGFTITGTSIRYSNTGTPNSGTVTATYTICNNETPPCCDTATVTVTICNTDA